MVNKPRRKGTQGENRAVTWLQAWWPFAERRALKGIRDTGDIAGTPYTISVKNAETWVLHKWISEHRKQMDNAGKSLGWIMARRSRQPFTFIVDEVTMAHLLNAAYGEKEESA